MSADSLEIRVVKLESDMRRIESVSEPRFERIEASLKKLEPLVLQVALIENTIKTLATKEDLANALTTQINRFLVFISIIVGLAVAANKLIP